MPDVPPAQAEFVPAPHLEKEPKKTVEAWEQMIFHKHAFSTTSTPRELYLETLKKRDYYGAVFFAVKQRFIRRRDGIVAARQFFSDTLPMRLDKKLGYEVRTSCNPFHESARQTMFLSPPPPLSLSLTLCCRCTSPTHSWSSTLTAAQMWLCASWSSLALCTLPKPTHRRLFACSCVCCCGWASWAKFGGPSRSCSARAARRLCGVSRALALAVVVVEVVEIMEFSLLMVVRV
jgi:hypothetical protein